MIAVEQLTHSPPDGYTLMISTSEATLLPFLKKSYRYDPIKDFTPIAMVATSWTVFAINPNVPWPSSSHIPKSIRCVTDREAPAGCFTSPGRCSS